MSYLIIEQPGVATISVPLSKRVLSLGRAEDNDVVLVADEVSRHHATLTRQPEGVVLRDLGSLNGTYVNRKQIEDKVLSNEDEIWFGSKCRIRFHEDLAAQRTRLTVPVENRPESDSTLALNIERIRADMDRVGNSMTLIGKQARGKDLSTTALKAASGEDIAAMGRAYRRLSGLYRASNEVSKLVASNADLPARLAKVLDTAIEVMEADRGFVMLKRGGDGELEVSVARQMGKDLTAGSPSMGIAHKAADTAEPVLMGGGERDSYFSARESIIVQQISSAMCVPLKVEDRVLGSIYVDTRRTGHTFEEEDLELFASMASQSALAVENMRLYEQALEMERKRAALGRFLSPGIVDEIMKEDTTLELGGRKQSVTTMFCDIRGFTPLAERMDPGGLVAMLNEHFTAMVGIVFEHEGTLDKYIGDEIMAVFGAPLQQEDDAERAVRAAVAMRAKCTELNALRLQEGRPTFEMGVGIASGEVIAGYIGAPERMEFTVVGDQVNVARRLCSVAQPGQVVIGSATYEQVKGLIESKPLGSVSLKGRELPVEAHEILSLKE